MNVSYLLHLKTLAYIDKTALSVKNRKAVDEGCIS
jgi:hypothetical protein